MPQAARAVSRDRASADLEQAEPTADLPPRRTITITGDPDRLRQARHLQVVPRREANLATSRSARLVQIERRRPPRRPSERLGARPDRIAMWAVMMALFLIVVAAASHP